jgi:uncharacterized protein
MTNIYTLSYQLSVKSINSMILILGKIKQQLPEKNHSETELLACRLAPDMYPLSRQIQLISDQAKGMVSRLAGIENPSMEDNETTIDELIIRLKKTVKFIQNIPEDNYAHADERQIILPWMKDMMPGKALSSEEFFLTFALPNFYFYMVTAYAILRNQGYEIGKFDYIGNLKTIDI